MAANLAAGVLLGLNLMSAFEGPVELIRNPRFWRAAFVVGLYGFALSGLPTLAFIAAAETARLRSVVAYVCAGSALGALIYAAAGFTEDAGKWTFTDGGAVVVAGFAGGLLYWALAGRHAGAWRD